MKISTRARYGTRLMVELGLHYGEGPIFLKDIAKNEDISLKYLSQIIIPLKTAGLVDSFRGAHGGYLLTRPPDQITMKEVIEILEGNFNLVECVKSPSSCSRISLCATRNLWSVLGEKITQVLEGVTLAALVSRCKEKQEHSICYSI
ncbi:MAG: Rrf2 family transcriptional regulator [Candidatus Omnitrophica bacterium]|nr:Rrf2 family transcriptional regulator [Candidatus Omnitrophota bacterium]MBU4478741.1 Rrf2 family transcriptional regulator [Candidatus Omnitrophota bacterium]MCG2703202.1 Rrf2 family transcriptional regulator [Candidatus Omnitrophota bacterium]